MKKILFTFFIFCAAVVHAQLSVLSTSIADGSTDIPLNTAFSVEFSSALDTNSDFRSFENFFTNIPEPSSVWYSSGGTTINFQLELEAGKDYFFLVFFAESETGVNLSQPYIVHFTTANSFSGSNVSGSVLSGNSGASIENALVILSSTPISDGEPQIEAAAFTNGLGAFTIKNVLNGTYYPLAAQDMDDNGSIDPDNGDALAIGDELIVDGPVTGLTLTLTIPDPINFSEAKTLADSLKTEWLVSDVVLKAVWGSNTDSVGNAGSWAFIYLSESEESLTEIRIDRFSNSQDNLGPFDYVNYFLMYTITNIENAAEVSTLLANTEPAGGADFRNQDYPDDWEYQLEVYLGDVRFNQFQSMVPVGTESIYWGASYRFYSRVDTNWQMEDELLFVAEYETGDLILTDLEDDENNIPNEFHLYQNYPNPFNPVTKIEFSLPETNEVNLTLYDLIGNKIITLVDGVRKKGRHSVELDARLLNGQGSELTSGVYFYRIQAGDFIQMRKLILIK